nr:MAG: hypothetical protein [Bacteriophage sp.]
MRQTTNNGYSFSYPDEVCFAFLPCIIKASGSNLSWIEVIIRHINIERSYNVETFNGSCITDFKTYVQALFDGHINAAYDWTIGYDSSILNRLVSIKVNAYDDGNVQLASVDFTTNIVWGAPKYGETWNGYKRLTWFTNYPFSFGMYLSKADTKLLIGYEGAPNKLLEIPNTDMIDFNAAILPSGARYWNIYDYDGEIQQGTFDNTFDLTFCLSAGGKQSLLLRIDRDDTESGIYLRWIDRHGFIRYWLFAAGEETREIASDLSFIRNNLDDYLYGYYGDNGRRQGYNRTDSIKLCAPLVDRDTFDMLQDLTSSPVVDMYLGGDWMHEEDQWTSVTIKAGSYTKSTACLQDFVCEMIINNINVQRL